MYTLRLCVACKHNHSDKKTLAHKHTLGLSANPSNSDCPFDALFSKHKKRQTWRESRPPDEIIALSSPNYKSNICDEPARSGYMMYREQRVIMLRNNVPNPLSSAITYTHIDTHTHPQTSPVQRHDIYIRAHNSYDESV